MSVILPPVIALKSSESNFYLNYSSGSDSENKSGLLRFNGTNVFSSLGKFEVVAANNGSGLVHIRCLHNKKFIQMLDNSDVISPEADEPEEDQSKWSCTLFEPILHPFRNPDKLKFHLLHVHAREYVSEWDIGGEKVLKAWNNPKGSNYYEFIDVESLVLLPKYVAFKANNGHYLQWWERNELRFISTDKGTHEAAFEVFTDGHGKVKIKVFNNNTNNYLRLRPDGGDSEVIFCEGDSNNSSIPPSEFWPVKIDARTVALKCLSSGKFCTLHTRNIQDALHADYTGHSITDSARLGLEELVLSRKIYNADFDLKNAIIYGETPVTMATANATNNTSEANTVEFKFSYKDSKSSKWSASHSWKVGVKVKMEAKVPFVGGAEVTANAEYSGSYEWGEEVKTENTLETTYKITVSPHTSLSVSLMATKGQCDVPYSYYQKDMLYNGKTIIYKKDDGLYTGVNSYNFHYEVTTLKKQDSKAGLLSKTHSFSYPQAIFTSEQQIIPMPLPYSSSGSTTVQTPVTPTATPEDRFSSPQVDGVDGTLS